MWLKYSASKGCPIYLFFWKQHREYKPQHKSVLFAQCFLCLVETVKQRLKPHSNWASSSFLLLVEIAFSCGRIRSLTPSLPAECPCQDMAWTSWWGLLPQTPGEQWRHKDMLLTSCLQPFPWHLQVVAALHWTLAPTAMSNDCQKNICDQPNVCGCYKH